MAKQGQRGDGVEEISVVADARLFQSGKEIVACEEDGIEDLRPETPHLWEPKAKGLYDKKDFHYVAEEDANIECPAGERLPWRMTSEEKGRTLHRYWSSLPVRNVMKDNARRVKSRRVTRWET